MSVKGHTGDYRMSTEQTTGSILLQPLKSKPFQLFVIMASQKVYAFTFLPQAIPAEPLVIVPGLSEALARKQQTEKLRRLLKAMRAGSPEYLVMAARGKWEALSPTLSRQAAQKYFHAPFSGTVYALHNRGQEAQQVTPGRLRRGKRWTALQLLESRILPGQTVYYYEVHR